MLSLSCLEPQRSPGSNNAQGGEGGGREIERQRYIKRERESKDKGGPLPVAWCS